MNSVYFGPDYPISSASSPLRRLFPQPVSGCNGRRPSTSRRSPPYVPLGCTARRRCSRPRFSASRKCREYAGARAAPRSRVVGSAAPQHLSKRLIWLTISRSPPAAARRRLARRLVRKLQNNSRETDEMSGRRRRAARRLRAPHDRRSDKSSAASTAYTIGRPTTPPCEAGKSRRQRPPGSPLAGVRA
jgi:hypothetical protein